MKHAPSNALGRQLTTLQDCRQPFLLFLDPQHGLGPVVLIIAHPRTLNGDARALLTVPVDVLAKLAISSFTRTPGRSAAPGPPGA